MRELVIAKLAGFIEESDGYGIPRMFDCSEEDMLTEVSELESMTDEELLGVFEATVGFSG